MEESVKKQVERAKEIVKANEVISNMNYCISAMNSNIEKKYISIEYTGFKGDDAVEIAEAIKSKCEVIKKNAEDELNKLLDIDSNEQ